MGGSLYTEKLGSGSPLILLPGWGMPLGVFQSIAMQFAKTHQVTSIDLPGIGKSAMLTKHYTLNNIASEILRYVPERAIWLGWSLGGLIALFIARHFPERVAQVFSIASSPKFIEEQPWPGIQSKTFNLFLKNLTKSPKETLYHFLMLQCHGVQSSKEIMQVLKKTLLHANPPHPKALTSGLNLLLKTDLRKDLFKIQCPLIFILGGKDILVPAAISRHLPFLGKNSVCLIIEASGHVPFLSHEEIFLNCIYKYLV